ncbi:PAAR domain-containing protein [Microbulbifer sp. 2304DJ12-6]|uniref:PAAR domain-containing protein n=1 Tax=Microbulbifer sp. 2304DJ12-6 TaxID=3233340 RepID=UPI0039AF0702
MPKAARLGDIGSGHGCFPPTPAISASGDTFINGRKAVRLGDAFAPHGCPQCPPHPRSLSAGSATVFINGKKAGRVGDSIGCGGSVSTGSGDTFIGDVGMGGPLKSCMKGAKDNASPLLDPGPIVARHEALLQPSQAGRLNISGCTVYKNSTQRKYPCHWQGVPQQINRRATNVTNPNSRCSTS